MARRLLIVLAVAVALMGFVAISTNHDTAQKAECATTKSYDHAHEANAAQLNAATGMDSDVNSMKFLDVANEKDTKKNAAQLNAAVEMNDGLNCKSSSNAVTEMNATDTPKCLGVVATMDDDGNARAPNETAVVMDTEIAHALNTATKNESTKLSTDAAIGTLASSTSQATYNDTASPAVFPTAASNGAESEASFSATTADKNEGDAGAHRNDSS